MHLSPEIPEDVKAEMDLEARRLGVARPVQAAPREVVPEDVRAELDHEARIAQEHVVGTLTEDGPPLSEPEAEQG